MGQSKNVSDAKMAKEKLTNEPPQVEDKSNSHEEKERISWRSMIMDLCPGKKGCSSSFPWGGKVNIPPGVFNKKEKLIAKMISPTERHLHTPPLVEAERLISEMFLLVARNFKFSSVISLEIPFIPENPDERDVQLRAKLASDQTWSTIEEFTIDAKANLIKFETPATGLFVVTSVPRTERFEVTPQGCLYNARINRYLSIRLPKKATDKSMTCEIKIHHVSPDQMDLMFHEYAHLTNDIISISNFYDINFLEDDSVTFRKGVSIKLPLSMCDEAKDGMENAAQMENGEIDVPPQGDLAVMHKTKDGWKLVEQTLKCTQTSVSFDVRALGRFILIRHKPDRAGRLKHAIPTLEEMFLILKGEILVSGCLCPKSWRLLLDVADKDLESIIAKERVEATWKRIDQEEAVTLNAENEVQSNNDNSFRRSRKVLIQKDTAVDPRTKDLNLHNGVIYKLVISGDIKALDDTPEERLYLQYHEKLTDNFTYFDIAPKPKESENGLQMAPGSRTHYAGYISVYLQDASTASTEDKENKDDSKRILLRKYTLHYNQKQLDDYYYVEPDPEPVKEVEKRPSVVVDVSPPADEVKPKPEPTLTPAMRRLTRPKQPPPKLASKEPKVLSGRSLKILSAAVEHGLTLAVHLNLPDSTITGIGFDSIANGLSMQDVTYKVLLHWKRTFKGSKEDQVTNLVESIKEMGRTDIAAVMMDRYRRDVELSPDCFDY